MPLYDYLCSCGETTARIRTYAQRLDTVKCPHCLGDAEYQFPVGAVRGIRFFEEQYCEPLGCDVTSERDMVEKAKKLGYVQAGDKGRGGRNEHDILAPTSSRRGISIDDKLREKDQREELKENWQSQAIQKDGSEVPVKEQSVKSGGKGIGVRHLTAPNRRVR